MPHRSDGMLNRGLVRVAGALSYTDSKYPEPH